MKRILYILTIVALGMTSCNKIEVQIPVGETQVHHFCIPATIGDSNTKAMSFDNSGATPTSTSTFSTSEEVFVYNSTQGALLSGTLKPTNLTNENKNCDLAGDLTGDIDPGDELTLYYNAVDIVGPSYSYDMQDGTAEGVLDGAIASVTVSDYTNPALTTTTGAHFSNLASMFRFKFKDETEAPIEVHALTVCSKNNSLIGQYVPLAVNPEQQYVRVSVPILIASPTTDYLYLSLFFDENLSNSSDALTFIADDGSYLYLGEKTAPSGGFKNGKYYYNTAPIQLTKMGALQTPTITWNNPDFPKSPQLDHSYSLGFTNGIDIGLAGTSFGYSFRLFESSTSTISLNSLTATYYDNPYINEVVGSLTMNISGDNSIDCRLINCSIFTVQTLKLQGSGTLTVTTNSSEFCGLRAINNYNPTNNGNATTDALDVSTQLAADGYTVTRSARTDNLDGTYTWTYTVAPAAPSYNQTKSINDGDVTVTAGEHWLITGTGVATSNTITIGAGATVTLSGVNISNSDYCIKCLGSATIILKDGTENSLVSTGSHPALWIGDSGTTLTIQGSTGKLTVTSASDCAGIGGGWENTSGTCGNIVIEGGIIHATGGPDGGPGIGSSFYYNCGSITISGGTVTAIGRGNYEASYGVGIGSGAGGSCGAITISGGTVTATGADNAAGIGSGLNGACGAITISGGTVTATGKGDGVGIGSGKNGSCGAITITVGVTKVIASKEDYSAPHSIGRGLSGTCGTVTIGGTVYWDEMHPGAGDFDYKNNGEIYLTENSITYPAP